MWCSNTACARFPAGAKYTLLIHVGRAAGLVPANGPGVRDADGLLVACEWCGAGGMEGIFRLDAKPRMKQDRGAFTASRMTRWKQDGRVEGRALGYGRSVKASVCLLIFAVRSSLSQLNGLPSMARLTVLKSTMEKSWR